MLFDCNNDCTQAPHCYLIRTLPVWFFLTISTKRISQILPVPHRCLQKNRLSTGCFKNVSTKGQVKYHHLFHNTLNKERSQGGINSFCHFAWASKCYTVTPNICGSSVWTLLYVTLVTPRILRWLLDVFKICPSLSQLYPISHNGFQAESKSQFAL
jgi:hypothetical protein